MKNVLLTTGIAAALLAGCDVNSPSADETNNAVAAALNTDASNAAKLLESLKAQDPAVVDVYFSGTPENKIINIARKGADGNITVTQMPYNTVVSGASPNGSQVASSGGSDMGTMLMAGAVGAMAGYMLGNMGNSSFSRSAPMSSTSYSEDRDRKRSSYVSSSASVYRSSYVDNYRSSPSSTPKAAAARSAGKSSGGSFSSSSSRGSSGGRGGSSGG